MVKPDALKSYRGVWLDLIAQDRYPSAVRIHE